MATQPHSECSSAPSIRCTHMLSLEKDREPDMAYDIFLSHSGAQKGFVKDMYKVLSPYYNTFLDIKHHSLPPGHHFPTRIFNAAAQCRVAVVVLSEEFVCSKWPMRELCAFVEALSSITILPLFYSLSPADLKDEANLKRWQRAWDAHAPQDANSRVDTSKWSRALAALCSLSGLIFKPSEGVLTYLDEIICSISDILSPAIKCDDHLINGKVRLCKVILEKFVDMVSKEQFPSKLKACVLGLYGPPGSGKSTMSLFLRNHFFQDFRCKALYMKLPDEHRSFTQQKMVKAFKRLLDLTDFRNRINLDKISDLREVIRLLKAYQLPSLRVFLVVDNVSDESMKAVRTLLELGVGPGSKVLLVARSLEVLNPALKMQGRYICDSLSMPSLLDSEAADLLLQTVGYGMGLEREAIETYQSPRHRERALAIARMCGFGSEGNMLYLPSVIEKVAEWLLRNDEDNYSSENQLGRFLEWEGTSKVVNYKCKVVRELLWESFRALPDPKLQLLFLDIALFVLPANIWSESEALEVLRLMHGCSQEKLEAMIKELQRSNFLIKISSSRFSVRDLYVEFAHSIKEHSTMQFLGPLSCWVTYKCADPDKVGRDLLLREEEMNNHCQVRTMILEVGEGVKAASLSGFSSLKALVVRNSESLTELKLVGLTLLVSLDIQNCPILKWVEVPQEDHNGDDLNIERRLKVWDGDGYIRQGEKSSLLVVRQKSEELHSFSSFRRKFI